MLSGVPPKPLILSHHLQQPDLISTGRAFLFFIQIPMNFALKMASERVILFTIFRGVIFAWWVNRRACKCQNLALLYSNGGSTMRRLLCFFFVFSSLTPAVAVSDDCGCSGQSVVLNDETREVLERWEAQQVWDRPTLLTSNVSAIIKSNFGDFTSQRVLSDPLRETNATRGNLFEEITTHSIATASRKTYTKEEKEALLAKARERYITNHKTRALMCRQFLSSDPNLVREFAETLKLKRISIEKVFLNLRCPHRFQ